MHRLMEFRYHNIEWPSTKLPITALLNFVLMRINEASGFIIDYATLTNYI